MQPNASRTGRSKSYLACGPRSLDLSHTIIMGILNLTPDSFSDGGQLKNQSQAVRRAEKMWQEGAQIIDVGGESTRPGAARVSAAQELDRVVSVIELICRNVDAVISIDSSKPAVMQAALAAGATMINDVRALKTDGALDVAVKAGVPICLMHMLGEPETMQDNPTYKNVTSEVRGYLYERAEICVNAGIDSKQILIDPGFGFGKTTAHNLELLRNLMQLGNDYRIVVGLSRKAMIRKLLGLAVDERLYASVALALIAVQNGASVLRVHDVGPTKQAIRMYEAVYSS